MATALPPFVSDSRKLSAVYPAAITQYCVKAESPANIVSVSVNRTTSLISRPCAVRVIVSVPAFAVIAELSPEKTIPSSRAVPSSNRPFSTADV